MRRLHVWNAAVIGEQQLEDIKSDVSPNNIQKMGAHKKAFLFSFFESAFLYSARKDTVPVRRKGCWGKGHVALIREIPMHMTTMSVYCTATAYIDLAVCLNISSSKTNNKERDKSDNGALHW
jgi:hypothetical protein